MERKEGEEEKEERREGKGRNVLEGMGVVDREEGRERKDN